MAGFRPRRAEGGHNSGEHRDFILKNSETFTVGDQVVLTSGFVALSTTDRPIGVIDGFVDSAGLPLSAQHAVAHGGTYSGTPGTVGSETLATASNNQTVAKIRGRIVVDHRQEFYNDANGSLTQAMVGQYFSSTNSDQINASTNSNSALVWVLTDIDPDSDGDASKGIFKIAQHAWNQ